MAPAEKQNCRSMEQDRNPERNPRTYGHLSLTKEARLSLTMEKRQSLLKNGCWGNWTAVSKRMKSEHLLPPYKNKFKWIKDLTVRPDTIKLLREKNTGQNTLT